MTRAGGLLSPLRYRDFRRLWIAQIASELGDWAARLGLVVLVAERTHSAALSALVITVSVIPFVGLGPLLATFANRFSRLHTIVFTDLGRAAIFALLALPMPTVAVFALAFSPVASRLRSSRHETLWSRLPFLRNDWATRCPS